MDLNKKTLSSKKGHLMGSYLLEMKNVSNQHNRLILQTRTSALELHVENMSSRGLRIFKQVKDREKYNYILVITCFMY